MSAIKAFLTSHGTLIGDAIENLDGTWTIKNPALLSDVGNQATLVPFLSMFEENEITLKEIDFGKPFTPRIEIRNHYNTLFGSEIVND